LITGRILPVYRDVFITRQIDKLIINSPHEEPGHYRHYDRKHRIFEKRLYPGNSEGKAFFVVNYFPIVIFYCHRAYRSKTGNNAPHQPAGYFKVLLKNHKVAWTSRKNKRRVVCAEGPIRKRISVTPDMLFTWSSHLFAELEPPNEP